jgi:hypothetical protein
MSCTKLKYKCWILASILACLLHKNEHTQRITRFVQIKVTSMMDEKMDSAVTNMETENALFMIHLNKSPGPDGFNDGFYIRH